MIESERIAFEALKNSEEDSIWLHEHYDELKVKYPDEVEHIAHLFVTPEKAELVL